MVKLHWAYPSAFLDKCFKERGTNVGLFINFTNMKQLIFTLLIISSSTLFSQTEVKKVLLNMATQEQAWNNGNIPDFMQYYWNNDSLKFIGSKGITYGWKKTLDNYLKSYPNKEAMGTLTFSIIEATQLSKTSIYVIGKWSLKKDTSTSSVTNKPAGGHFTLLWKKINNQWVIVADHTS